MIPKVLRPYPNHLVMSTTTHSSLTYTHPKWSPQCQVWQTPTRSGSKLISPMSTICYHTAKHRRSCWTYRSSLAPEVEAKCTPGTSVRRSTVNFKRRSLSRSFLSLRFKLIWRLHEASWCDLSTLCQLNSGEAITRPLYRRGWLTPMSRHLISSDVYTCPTSNGSSHL